MVARKGCLSTAILAETIINLMKNEDRLLEVGRNGRRIAEAHDWKHIANLDAIHPTAKAAGFLAHFL
jgi:hypothetical protein